MSTPLYWQEFSKEWRKALDDESIPIEPDKEHPIFHTSEFKTRQIPFRDYLGWSNDRREVFYKRLIDLVNKRTLFSTATGIDLDDYRRFAVDYPASQKLFGSAGHFASVMSFWRCRYWASKYSYDETISYIYDRDDTFADELRDSYNNLCKDRDRAKWWHFKPGGLRDEDKQYFPPIQAADLVAWEMGRDIRDYYDGFKLEAISRPEFVKLNVYGAEYYLYGYEDFLNWWHEREREIKDAKES